MWTQQFIPLVCLLLSCTPVASWGLFKRAAVVITKPNSGDTIVAKADFDIEWQHSTDNNVTISLRQGTSDNMTLVHVITGMSGLPTFDMLYAKLLAIHNKRLISCSCSKHIQQWKLCLAIER